MYFNPNCSKSLVRGRYAAEWAHDGRRLKDAQRFRVRKASPISLEHRTTIVDGLLDRAGSISGSVADNTGAAPSTCAAAYLADSEAFDVRFPDSTGHRWGEVVAHGRVEAGRFLFNGLGPGDYRVLVGCLSYANEWPAPFGYIPTWTNVVTLHTPGNAEADPVGIDRAGTITGRLVDQHDRRQLGCIDAWRSKSRAAGGSYTNVAGAFDGPRLPSGTYRVSVSPYNCSSWEWWYDAFDVVAASYWWYDPPRYDRTFFDRAPTFGSGTPIEVTAGSASTITMGVHVLGADLELAELTVTDPTIKTAFLDGPATGVRKEVEVTVRQNGILRPSYWWYPSDSDQQVWARVVVWAESRDQVQNDRVEIFSEEFQIGEDATRRFSLGWTPVGAVGDIRITAETCVLDRPYPWGSPGTDVYPGDNRRTHETYIGVGGLGGATIRHPWPPPYFSSYPNRC